MVGRRALLLAVGLIAIVPPPAGAATAPKFPGPTNSSPIVLSRDGRFVWTVSPGNDRVLAISTRTNKVVKSIRVGHQPESVAITPSGKRVYVANAASGTVTAIKVARTTASRVSAAVDRKAGRRGSITTGAEPWNLVVTPDGRRVFVANSAQDTITILNAATAKVIGTIRVANSRCNDPDRLRHFQPRGLAVSKNSRRLLATAFFAFVRAGGHQSFDDSRQGLVCVLAIKTRSKRVKDYRPTTQVALSSQVTGFKVDSNGDGAPDNTSAFPNQLQSVVIRGNQAYLPNIAASPQGPLRFNVDTQAFVNVIDNASAGTPSDAGAAKSINLHLGARNPEQGKKRLFFANPWAIAFAPRTGADTVYGPAAATAYVVSAASDLLVKVLVRSDGKLVNTVDNDTTRYIDLADPAVPATAGANAGHKPQGIVINRAGTRAYVANFVSRNVSIVDLTTDTVIATVRTALLPPPGSTAEVVNVGAQVFFSSRGHFDRPANATVSTDDRLASEGWQSCSSCHFEGWTDGIIWQFNTGPRKSVPLYSTFNPHDRANDQRVLNYSAIFDEVEDFEANIRNVSGPGNLAAPTKCSEPPPGASAFDPNHGLLIGDNGDVNTQPCVIAAFTPANANRPQLTITVPGSTTAVPALTALREWVRNAVRPPNAPLTTKRLRGGVATGIIATGRQLFQSAGCAACHGGSNWTISKKDFTSPPAATELATETTPPPKFGRPPAAQYLPRFLRDIGSFGKGVPNVGNDIGADIGAPEIASANIVNGVSQAVPDALGVDFNGDGKGAGYNVPSLLGIFAAPPYYHNGACETLACVVSDLKHRTANGTQPDKLADAKAQAAVVAYVRQIDKATAAP